MLQNWLPQPSRRLHNISMWKIASTAGLNQHPGECTRAPAWPSTPTASLKTPNCRAASHPAVPTLKNIAVVQKPLQFHMEHCTADVLVAMARRISHKHALPASCSQAFYFPR
jgi:hypothetical protein